MPSSAPASVGPSSWPGAQPSGAAVSRRGLARQLALLSALGVLAATLLSVCSNVLVARFYKRWDVTSAGLYTLSPATVETLHGLSETVDIIVFLSQSDPDFGGVSRLLDQYRAESRLISLRYIDPDRDPAEFIALQNRYRLSEQRAEGGHLVSDAAVVVARGDARWVIGAKDITEYDEVRGLVQPRVEQAVTEGLRQVLDPTVIEVCFVTGHGEALLGDAGPTGLGAIDYMLRQNNYATRELALGPGSSALALSRCDLAIVAAPRDRMNASDAAQLVSFARQGKALFVSVGPSLDEENRANESGLEPLFDVFGVRLKPGLIFEREPDAVLPVGLGGEAFLASPKPHAITQSLMQGGESRARVLVQLARGLELRDVGPKSDDRAPDAVPKVAPLLGTSDRAFGVLDAGRLAEGGVDLDKIEHDSQGPYNVAMAVELGAAPEGKRPGRMVLLGSASPLLGATFQDASLAGTRRFVESAISWLVSRPALVSLPDKPGRQVELRFTEESLGQVVRYVLVYMPLTALALGGLVLYRRRSVHAARPRAARPPAAGPPSAGSSRASASASAAEGPSSAPASAGTDDTSGGSS